MNGWKNAILLGAGAVLLSGCFGRLSPAGASVGGFRQPVLLGPVDRIGGTEPRVVEKVGTYDAVSKAAFSQRSDSRYQYTIETVDETEPYTHAVRALAGKGERADLRLKMIRAWSRGYFFGLSNKVALEADAVLVGGER